MTQLIDLGKLRFYFAGTWSSSQEYELNDIVKYGGNVYVYTHALATTGNLPTNTSYWKFMVGGIDFKGTYSPSTAYKVGEAVSHGATVYVATANTTGNTPPNALYWEKIAEGVQYEGVYAAGTQYQKNDIVFYSGAAYIALADTLGNTPNYSANTSYWGKLVNSAYPDQTNHNLAVLQTDGTEVSWSDTPSLNSVTIVGETHLEDKVYIGAEGSDFHDDAALTAAQLVVVVDSGTDPYGQVAVHNMSPTASTDLLLYSDNGTDSTGWIDVGITGSQFQQEEFGITGPNDGYIFFEAPEVLTATITNKALTDDVATITTSAAHGFSAGQTVNVTGIDSTFNGDHIITSVTSTTFSYAKDTATNVASTPASGTATVGTTGEGNLVFATGDKGTANKIVFAAGGFASGTTQMEIIPDQNVHIEIDTPSTSASTGALTVVGGVGIQGDMNIAGDVAIVGNLTFGGGSTVAEALEVNSPMIYAGTGNTADTFDLGIIGEYATTVSPITATITNKALTSNVVTLTTSTSHNYLVGDVVTITGVGSPFDGTYSITVVPSATTFRYAKTATDVVTGSATGTASVGARRKFAGVVRDASDGKLKAFKDATTKPTSTVNFSEAGLGYADFRTAGLESTTIAASGNTTVGGTLTVTGLTTLNGGITTSGDARITGKFDVQELREDLVTSSITSNIMACDFSLGGVFYNSTAPSANYTVNLTNAPTDNGKTFSFSVMQVQGATGYIPNAFQIDGVSQTLRWGNGSAPTPTSSSGKIDIFNFTLVRTGSAWIVLGNSNLNY